MVADSPLRAVTLEVPLTRDRLHVCALLEANKRPGFPIGSRPENRNFLLGTLDFFGPKSPFYQKHIVSKTVEPVGPGQDKTKHWN